MGQYYKFIILSENNDILLVLNPHYFYFGAKLMEFSYNDTDIMNTIEYLLGPYEKFNKYRCVIAGDYADNENNSDENLYKMTELFSSFQQIYKNIGLNFIVNHTKKLFVDNRPNIRKRNEQYPIHPLALLICEGNGRGGGDYNGTDYELLGTWARDNISMEFDKPNGYEELVCDFID